MSMNFPQVHMPEPFAVVCPTAKKAAHKLELGLSRMVQPVTTKMQPMQRMDVWIGFHSVIETFHKIAQRRLSSKLIQRRGQWWVLLIQKGYFITYQEDKFNNSDMMPLLTSMCFNAGGTLK